MAGNPFQSKLTPHFDLIAIMRRQHKSWQAIADHLATLGVKTDKGNLCAFFKRHRARPVALGMEENAAPRRTAKSEPALPPEEHDLSEFLPQPSEFEAEALPIRRKKMWSIIAPSQNP